MKTMRDPFNIITASVGGQGNIVSSDIIGSAAVESGLKVTIGETHGLSQRGGSVLSNIRISRRFQYGPIVPAGEADLILGFEPLEALKVFMRYGKEGTVVLLNERPNYPTTVLSGIAEYPEVADVIGWLEAHGATVYPFQATELARKAGNPVAMNIVMVGAFAGAGAAPDIEEETWYKVLRNTFSGERLDLNIKAFELGRDYIKNYIENMGR